MIKLTDLIKEGEDNIDKLSKEIYEYLIKLNRGGEHWDSFDDKREIMKISNMIRNTTKPNSQIDDYSQGEHGVSSNKDVYKGRGGF